MYGIEPWTFYIRNGLLNFNLALVLAFSYPAVYSLQAVGFMAPRRSNRLALATMPLFLWMAALSMLPHKEERFLYVVYPQVRLVPTDFDACGDFQCCVLLMLYLSNVDK